MEEISSKNSTNAREFRRLRAVELFETGIKQIEIAKALGVTRGAVCQWIKTYKENGKAALCYKKYSKNPCRLSQEQQTELVEMLKEGAEKYGFQGQIWTQARVSDLIMRKFGIRYHSNHIGKLLKKLGWSWQKPVLRASQRNEDDISDWCEHRWPEIKKSR